MRSEQKHHHLGGDVPITSFDGSPSVPVPDGEIPIESLAGSIEGDDIPVHSFDDVPVEDMEELMYHL